MNTGVYQILNTLNGNKYIGSAARSFGDRWNTHKSLLKSNKHHSKPLQRAYNKYGLDFFRFEILAYCPKEYCIKIEQWWLDNIKPEYNACKIAGNTTGIKPSQQTISNIIKANTGRIPWNKGVELTAEVREKLSKGRIGHKWTKGIKKSPEHIEKIRAVKIGNTYRRGTTNTPESIEKMSVAKHKFVYKILTPNGEIVETRSLSKFAKENNLCDCTLGYTLKGARPDGIKIHQCKGYRVLSKESLIKT